MARYIYLLDDWTNFVWDGNVILPLLGDVRNLHGRILEKMSVPAFSLQEEATLNTLTTDVLKTSEIKGERLNKAQVRSSIARRLGIEFAGMAQPSRDVEGIVEMMLDATQNYRQPIDEERLFGWHAALFTRSDDSSQRFYSMSNQILKERKKYYAALEKSQHGDNDITHWMNWFLSCLKRALLSTENTLQSVFQKADFWKKYSKTSFNDRQKLMLNKLLDGFDGKLKSSKWAKITKCSADTALIDIKDLIEKGVLKQEEAGGRSTNYEFVS